MRSAERIYKLILTITEIIMNPLKTIYWQLMASFKGMSYEDYLRSELEAKKKQLAELPDTDNFLSLALEYYSFKNVKCSCEVLVFIFGLSLCVYVASVHFEFDFIYGVMGVWLTQGAMFVLGFYLKRKYK